MFGAEREALLREKFRCFARQVIAHLDAAQDAAWRAAGGRDLARDLAVLPAACREPERKRGQPAAPQHDESRQRRQHRHAERGQRRPGMGKAKASAQQAAASATAARRAASASASAFEFAHRGRGTRSKFRQAPTAPSRHAGGRAARARRWAQTSGAASATSSGRT